MEVNDNVRAPTALPSENNFVFKKTGKWVGSGPGLDVVGNEEISELPPKSGLP
jgi:hypothetical protein